MHFISRALAGLILLVATVAMIGYGGWRLVESRQADDTRPRRPVDERSFVVNTATLKAVTTEPETTVYGEIKSWRTFLLRAPVAGEVIDIAPEFRDGVEVSRGDILFAIDPEDYKSRIADMQAALDEALAEKAEAEEAIGFSIQERDAADRQRKLQHQELERQRRLFDRGLATESDVSSAELAYSASDQTWISRNQAVFTSQNRSTRAALAIDRAHIALKEAERNLAETRVTAAFDGVLDGVNLTLGQRLSANEQVGALVDPIALEAVFRVPNNQFGRLLDDRGALLKQPVTIVLRLGEREVETPGKISRVGPVVASGQSGRVVYARLETGTGTVLRSGDFVTVRIREPALHDVAIIPATAADEKGKIFVLDEEQRLVEFTVNILRRIDDELIVRPGKYGMVYVRERLPQLASGVKVRPSGGASDKTQVSQNRATDMIALDANRRDALLAFVKTNIKIPKERREKMVKALSEETVPADMVERIESRMGR